MKKTAILFFSVLTLTTFSQKSFEKKTNVIGFGADLGGYVYTSYIGSSNKSERNGAVNKLLSLQYERGILNWLGIGAKVQLSDYFTQKDSITNEKPSVRAIDAIVLVNVHLIRTRRVDVLLGTNVGYSRLNWEARDAFVSNAKGNGLMYDIHLQPRFYFGNRVGMFVNLAYVNYNYRNMDFTNTFTKLDDVLDLVGGGVNFGIGLNVKF